MTGSLKGRTNSTDDFDDQGQAQSRKFRKQDVSFLFFIPLSMVEWDYELDVLAIFILFVNFYISERPESNHIPLE